MKRTFKRIISTILLLACAGLQAEEGDRWIFEGLITEVNPRLAPELQGGWVLAGSFLLAQVEMEEEPLAPEVPGGRLSGGISQAEISVDLYHQLHFEAAQIPGLAGFDYQNDDPERDGRDLLGWFFPVGGQLKESQWSSRWLQVWLVDPEGKMIRDVPPRISPYGIKFKTAWFRLTFANDAGESVFADGRMDVFLPESQVDELDEATHWRGVAVELGNQLMEKDSVISGLRKDLASAQARLSGLRNMVDLLVQEREHLQTENRLLAEEAAKADPEVDAKLTDLTLEKSFLEQAIDELSDQNQTLSESLAASEVERRHLLNKLEDLQRDLEDVIDPTEPPKSIEIDLAKDGRPVGTMTIIEQPMVIEKPVVVEVPVPVISTREPDAPSKPAKKKGRTSRHGPRKFR
jgi:uncharacterized coiled-coil protein SlyX